MDLIYSQSHFRLQTIYIYEIKFQKFLREIFELIPANNFLCFPSNFFFCSEQRSEKDSQRLLSFLNFLYLTARNKCSFIDVNKKEHFSYFY